MTRADRRSVWHEQTSSTGTAMSSTSRYLMHDPHFEEQRYDVCISSNSSDVYVRSATRRTATYGAKYEAISTRSFSSHSCDSMADRG